ncbi:MAG: hypothetical protein AB1540_16010 [Bdellovibrionota bacterium]
MAAKVEKKAKTSAKKTAAPSKTQKGGAMGTIKKMLGINAKSKSQKPNSTAKGAASAKQLVPAKKTAAANPPAAKSAKKQGAPLVSKPEKKSGKKGGSGLQGAKSLTSLSISSTRAEPRAEASGAGVCREVACELVATTGDYCRMHYIKNWKKIKRKETILKERKLNHYIEELVSKYPDKYIEAIRQDLASEKDFAKVIADLEIEETMDDFEAVETESAEGIIDNLKRDFEDEGDVF